MTWSYHHICKELKDSPDYLIVYNNSLFRWLVFLSIDQKVKDSNPDRSKGVLVYSIFLSKKNDNNNYNRQALASVSRRAHKSNGQVT